jgi:enamine deaminase RidA (YjgF/YER057c/UK114 family)
MSRVTTTASGATASTVSLGFLPAPAHRRAGDFIFVSSLYPVDDSGQVVGSDSISPYIGESDMAAQSRRVLEQLDQVLAGAGSSLPLVLKAEVYLADAADFPEFKLVWKEFFPDSPPARTTVVVGDEHILPGCRLNLHAVALADDASVGREAIIADGIPNPMDAEHASHAVKAAPFVFPSAFPATDFETGVPVGRNLPNFPNYGSDAEMQTHYILENLSKVCEAAGTSIDQAVKSQFYETNLLNFHDVDGVWAQYMGLAPPRSSMACRGFVVPGALFAPNLIYLIPDAEHEKKETQAGIRWHPEVVRAVHFSPGITAGDWLFTAGQVPMPDFGVHESIVRTPGGLPNYWSDIEVQTDFTMVLLREQLEANGLGLSDIVDARVYLIDPRREYRGFARAWDRLFESVDRKPSMSIIPTTQENGATGIMFEGPIIEIDLISKKGD